MDTKKYELAVVKKTEPLLDLSQELLGRARAATVTTDDELRAANALKTEINKHNRTVSEMRLEMTRPLDEAKKYVIAREREITNPLEDAKNAVAEKILDYEDEQERKRQAERQRIADIESQLQDYYTSGINDVETAQTQLHALKNDYESLPAADKNHPAIAAAYSSTSNGLNNRIEDIKAEERAEIERKRQQEEQERLDRVAAEQSAKERELAEERAKIEADKRKVEEEKRQIELEKQREIERKEQEERNRAAEIKRKADEAAEAARPKSNIVTTIKFEITDADRVPRTFCSPDERKINQYIREVGQEALNRGVDGIRFYAEKKVR